MTPVQRQTARILPVDGRGRVLLLFGRDPARPSSPCWFTVGGGIDEGETALDAAVREMREETGIRVEAADLFGPLDRLLHSYSYAGQDFVSDSTFFAAAVDHTEISRAGLDEDEAANILEAAWWAPDDLVAAPLQPGLPLLELARAAVAAVARSRAEAKGEHSALGH